MPWLSDGVGVLEKGGPVMFVILALSILALTIILVKILHFGQARLRRLGFVEDVLTHLTRGDVDQARMVLLNRLNPVARVMEMAIDAARDSNLDDKDREAEISRVGSNEIRHLESYLRGLEVIAGLSPLLGLLGTVFGMIRAFVQLEQAGSRVDPALLAGGIWEALLTTAFGLTVAIPTLGAFYIFEGQVDRVRAAMRDAVTRVNVAFRRNRPNAQN